ncbi:hypothetical protein [Furfurilactobacillus entadae]|uniref:hypothetical protein n=1 Tax=Furfurilactobacillus entadae TaxID=2922307 RepID=UPI0035F07F95
MDKNFDNDYINNPSEWDQVPVDDSVNGYSSVDITNPTIVSYKIPMHPRVGDRLRPFPIRVTSNQKTLHFTQNTMLNLYGDDPESKIKVQHLGFDGVPTSEQDAWGIGRATLLFPQEWFLASGTYKQLMLEVVEGPQVLGTVNFSLSVQPNEFATLSVTNHDFDSDFQAKLDTLYKSLYDQFQAEFQKFEGIIQNAQTTASGDLDAFTTYMNNIKKQLDDATGSMPERIALLQTELDAIQKQIDEIVGVFEPQVQNVKFTGSLPSVVGFTYNYGAGQAQTDPVTYKPVEQIEVQCQVHGEDSTVMDLYIKSLRVVAGNTYISGDGKLLTVVDQKNNPYVSFQANNDIKFMEVG